MFGHRFFGARMFAPRYFPPIGIVVVIVPIDLCCATVANLNPGRTVGSLARRRTVTSLGRDRTIAPICECP
jgi:hypothetical protein